MKPLLATAIAVLTAAGIGLATAEDTKPDARHIDRGAIWQRSGHNALAGFRNMYHASVLAIDDPAFPYRLWFFGWASDDCNPGYPGCDAIYVARSRNLDSWQVYCGDGKWDATGDPTKWTPVLAAQDKPYDGWHNGDPSVCRHGDCFYMAYSATGFNRDGIPFGGKGDTDGDLYCVMGARSEDGIRWERTPQPIVIYAPEIGAPGDRQSDAFVYGMYHRPSLLFDEGKWRLWFDYWTGHDVAMGYAEAKADAFMAGGFRVLRAGDAPLLHEWPNPSVVKIGDRYHAFADPSGYGVGWPGRQLAEAESEDGIHWRILGWIPPDADTPACHVPSATVLREKDEVWLVVFYACQIGGEPYDYRYDRIRYMKRPIGDRDAGTHSGKR